MDNKGLKIRHDIGVFEDVNGNEREVDNFFVDVDVDGLQIPIKVKPNSPTFAPIMRGRISKGDNLELYCDGVESFKTGGKDLNFYRFYSKVKVNGILRKCFMKIAQGEQKIDKAGNKKMNTSVERSLILASLGIQDVYDSVVDEDEV